MEPYRPDMTMSWRGWPVVTPNQPQNTTLPVWGGVGGPLDPGTQINTNTPSGYARRMLGLGGLGAYDYNAIPTWVRIVSAAGLMLGTYHGYKRNRGSIGWAFGWSVFGALLPMLALPVMFIQGLGKPAKRGR